MSSITVNVLRVSWLADSWMPLLRKLCIFTYTLVQLSLYALWKYWDKFPHLLLRCSQFNGWQYANDLCSDIFVTWRCLSIIVWANRPFRLPTILPITALELLPVASLTGTVSQHCFTEASVFLHREILHFITALNGLRLNCHYGRCCIFASSWANFRVFVCSVIR